MEAVPVRFVTTPDDGVPKAGVTSVGEVANTRAPEPVSSVTADDRLALEGVARNVATFEPSPVIPVDTGSPVALVSVTGAGVPRPSHVLVALGLSESDADASLRISIGTTNTKSEIDQVLAVMPSVVERARNAFVVSGLN
jgi:hypothetical protein